MSSRKIEEIFKKYGRIVYSDIAKGYGSIVNFFLLNKKFTETFFNSK